MGPARHVADALHPGDPGRRRRSACSTTARCAATSRTSTTSWKASCARSSGLPWPGDGGAPYAIYNIGNHEAVELETFIATLEQLLGRAAIRDYQPMQAGDVPATYASIDRLRAATGFAPRTPLAEGLARFVEWYRGYYR